MKVKGSNFTTTFNKVTGVILSHFRNGVNYMIFGVKECLTRSLTGLDAKEGWWSSSIWEVFDNMNTSTALKGIFVNH